MIPANDVFSVTTEMSMLDPILDRVISYEEVVKCLLQCKNGKAPGVDGICNEFFKNLPQNWILYVTNLFNCILEKETVPKSWGEMTTTMLYKKGDKTDPGNYRPITLVNCVAKLFTQIIYSRMIDWLVGRDLIPESQSGFRKGRSCLDNLFTLLSVMQIHLHKPKTVLYALFIYFKGAFPSISHSLLWKKLYNFGFSNKLIKILISFYSQAYTCIKNNQGSTEFIKITRGVLQGEILSPLLFLLYICDMEDFFYKKDCRGISINHDIEIMMLGYADDYVMLSDSPLELHK